MLTGYNPLSCPVQMYAERDQDHSIEFNCVQRAHQV
jgi:hypothetical protein